MKNLFTFLILFLTINFSIAQSFYPLPEQNAQWNTIFANGGMVSQVPPISHGQINNSTYYTDGDTTINQLHYVKLSEVANRTTITIDMLNQDTTTYTVQVYSQNIGAFRNDSANRRVYFLQYLHPPEQLLYDFNVQPGTVIRSIQDDPINGWYGLGIINFPDTAVVDFIDSILVDATYRRRINMIGNAQFPMQVIEGVGGTSGLLNGVAYCSNYVRLLCLSINGIPVFPDTATSCLMVNTSELLIDEEISIYPNPNNGTFTLNSFKDFVEADIFDSHGSMVFSMKINSETKSISIPEMPDGLYILRIYKTSGTLNKKFIVKK